MAFSLRKLRRTLLGVSPKKATSFSEGNSELWHHLETVVLSALEGYHSTLDSNRMEVFVPQLDKVALEHRGYAYEGAAMGLTGLDCMSPWKNRLQAYIDGPGSPHIYMVHIGAGEALALFRRKPERFMARLKDPSISWLVIEGYGFHHGFFHHQRFVEEKVVPKHLSNYARCVFDQGLGRSIWFLGGANGERVAAKIATFPQERQADLWLGIGVGSTYVGGLERPALEALRQIAGPYAVYMAIGAAFVAKGRKRAGNPVPHTDLSCEVFCGLSADQAAHETDLAFLNLPADTPQRAFEVLQQRLLTRFSMVPEPVYQQKEA